MEFIERQNVLDLIGRDSRRYHSCIITCYSFDFTYFEERVLPVFRASNIRNVNVFVDGNSLESSQEMLTGKEFSFQKNYSLIPVYNEKGVSHPKIILLTGFHEGLLIVGSGNITSSGLNNNDEIWGAFHFKDNSEKNAKIFYEIWAYLENYFPLALGVSSEKLNWFTNNSPWISTLGNLIGNESKEPIVLTQSFYKNILKEIPKENVLEISVVSPYFDKEGKVIQQLQRDFSPQKINVLIDESGILPSEFPFEKYNNVKFYHWKDAKNEFNDNFNRLHAKLIHFQYLDKEILVFGSANATISALGDENNDGINSEVSLLIKREKRDKNWLKQLQIKIPEKTIHLDIIKNFKKYNYSTENKIKLQNAILYAENQSNRIVVFTKYSLSEEDTITCFDKFGIKTKNYEYLEINEKTYAFNSQGEEIFKIAIERNGERISNFSLIHNALNLIKTNPNQVNAELEALLNSDFSENNGLTDLLKYVETDWADETSLQVKTNFTSISKVGVKSAKDEIEKEYEILDYEEFNQKNLTSFYRKFAILQNSNLKIADFFNALAKGLDANSQFLESEELKLVIDNDAENGGEGNKLERKNIDELFALKEINAINNFLTKVYKFLLAKTGSFFQGEKFNDLTILPEDTFNITIFSKLLIALDLINAYRSKKFNGLRYIIEGNIDDYHYIKGFLIQTIGLGFLVYHKGFSEYDNQYLNQKFESYKTLFSEKIIELVCDIFWKESERKYVSLLLLNLIKFTGNKNIIQLFNSKANEKFNETKILLSKYEEWEAFYANFEDRKKHLICDISSDLQGEIMFNSKLGFGFIKSTKTDGMIIAEFQTGEFTVKLGQKCVLFRI